MASLCNIEICDKNFQEICDLIKKSWVNACVLWVDEVVNEELREKYINCKKEIINKRGEEKVKETQLFHGCNSTSITPIINNGFDKSLNKRSLYGKGIYCSKNGNYSKEFSGIDNDISYIFICDVIIGNCCIGKPGLVIDNDIYDCAVDNIENPKTFVFPYNYAVFPKYIVAFHKNASV